MNIKTIALSVALAAAVVVTPLLGGAAHADTAHRGFVQINRSNVSIVQMFIAASDLGDWSEVTLHQGPIAPGTARTIMVGSDPGECLFDVEVDMSDGGSTVTQNVNVCLSGTQLTLSTQPGAQSTY